MFTVYFKTVIGEQHYKTEVGADSIDEAIGIVKSELADSDMFEIDELETRYNYENNFTYYDEDDEENDGAYLFRVGS